MRSGFRTFALAFVLGVACRGGSDLSFEVSIPSAVAGKTKWLEVGAFRDTRCTALGPTLGGGIPSGAAKRVAFSRTDPAPRVGDLPSGSYAFGAVARGDDCAVLASGCTEADVTDVDAIVVNMSARNLPTGACTPGSVCRGAQCLAVDDNSNATVGAGCSLELLGGGPLATPIVGAGTRVSAPAIAATPKGFVIAYREVDPIGTIARVTLLPIDSGGGALTPQRPALPNRCAESDETDGIGIMMDGESGAIALARAPCSGTRPALELLTFSTNPEVTVGDLFISNAQTDNRLLLSTRPAAAVGTGGVLVFTDATAGTIATVDRARGIVAPSGTFGGTSGLTGAWAASSDQVLGVLSSGPPPAPIVDGGVDAGGTDAGSGSSGATMQLLVLPARTTPDQFDVLSGKPKLPIVFPGTWGALAASGTRVIVLSSGGSPGRTVTFRSFELDNPAAIDTGGFVADGAGDATTGDVVIRDDRVVFVVLKPGSIALAVYDKAMSKPELLRQKSFSTEPSLAQAALVRDGRVAIAATDTRIAVAWTTASLLSSDDPTGGYAVFACTP